MRFFTELKWPTTDLYMYNTFICLQIEYALTIQNPFYHKYSAGIKIVQRKFLRALPITIKDRVYRIYNCEKTRTYLEFNEFTLVW